jgi:hypothetical protein
VFKFYNQHTQTPAASIVGPNTYAALARADAFRKVRRWGMKTSMEVGSVKEFFCVAGSGGMEASIRNTIEGIRAIEAAGGRVDSISMDEPWVSGKAAVCGGPALEPTADMVAVYMQGVSRAFPRTSIGLIEAYPFSNADEIERMLRLMQARGVPPAFLHMDVNWKALRPGEFARDMTRLHDVCRSMRIPFGIILVGYSDADTLYGVETADLAHLVAETYRTWDAMPDHVIFQSWVSTPAGQFITPSNLPEDRLHSHTNLVWALTRLLRGATGGPAGRAVPKN